MAKIKGLGVMKTAYFAGIFGVFLGLITAILSWIIILVVSKLGIAETLEQAMPGATTFSPMSFIVLPLMYGVILFVSALIFIPIANLILKWIKGIDLDLIVK